MGWDIYGQYLAPGHCEVHPHIAESYPCSRCEEEYYQNQRDQDEVEKVEEYYRQLAEEHDRIMVWEFWSCHVEDPIPHPMEFVTSGD